MAHGSAFSAVRPTLRAVASVVIPDARLLDEKGWQELERLIEAALRDRPEALRRRLLLFLRLLEWLPVLRYGRPFTSLDAARRARCLAWLEAHPVQLLRTGFWGLRTLVLLGYYGQPAVARAIGYAADPRGWEALR